MCIALHYHNTYYLHKVSGTAFSIKFFFQIGNQKVIQPLHSKLLEISLKIATFIKVPNLNGLTALPALHSSSKL